MVKHTAERQRAERESREREGEREREKLVIQQSLVCENSIEKIARWAKGVMVKSHTSSTQLSSRVFPPELLCLIRLRLSVLILKSVSWRRTTFQTRSLSRMNRTQSVWAQSFVPIATTKGMRRRVHNVNTAKKIQYGGCLHFRRESSFSLQRIRAVKGQDRRRKEEIQWFGT